MRTQTLNHLAVSAPGQRHDMAALKTRSVQQLRQNAPTGRKVLWIWDRAGIDFEQWRRWKQSNGVYFISRPKKNFNLQIIGQRSFDQNDPRNAGVVEDCYVSFGFGSGYTGRLVRWIDSDTGDTWEFITNLNDRIAPGIIAQLYLRRWDIEKVFDEIKNKLDEQKAWATSNCSKEMQALFVCMAYNLGLALDRMLALEHRIENIAEAQRKNQRASKAAKAAKAAALRGQRSFLFKAAQRLTQRSVKFWRWIRRHLLSDTLLTDTTPQLQRLYARL